MGEILIYAVENVKVGSERPEGTGHSLSRPSRPYRDPTPSGASSPIRPVSDRMQFGNHNNWTSGEEVVAGSGWRRSLGSIPLNRPIEKVDEDGRGYLGG